MRNSRDHSMLKISRSGSKEKKISGHMSGIPMGGAKNFSGIRTETFFDEKMTEPGFFYETK